MYEEIIPGITPPISVFKVYKIHFWGPDENSEIADKRKYDFANNKVEKITIGTLMKILQLNNSKSNSFGLWC